MALADVRHPFWKAGLLTKGAELPNGTELEAGYALYFSGDDVLLVSSNSLARLARMLHKLQVEVERAVIAELPAPIPMDVTKEEVVAQLVEIEAADVAWLEEAVAEVEATLPALWLHELTHEQREGEYRDKLLEAASQNETLGALLWSVSPAPIWDTDGMVQDFTTIGFQAPFVVVTRNADGTQGSLEFTHRPRFYFNFVPTA